MRWSWVVALAVVCSACSSSSSHPIKNVILMVGDGMGPQQIGLAALYAKHAKGSQVPDHQLAMEKMMLKGVGIMNVETYDSPVTDSAASSTQMATGKLSRTGMIGLDYNGESAPSILDKAERAGKSTGLVTVTRITDATPAGFSAHQASRRMDNEIAIDELNSGTDVLLAGGMRHFLPKGEGSKRTDDRDLISEFKQKGYAVVANRVQLEQTQSDKILGLFAANAMPDALAMREKMKNPDRRTPTLTEMTQKAIETLSRNPKGFFLMVEGGQIDVAGHGNDAGRMLHETLQFDEAIRAALKWAANRDDTLVVVVADHETGGFGFSYSRYNIPAPVPLPGKAFADKPYQASFNFGNYALLDKLFAQDMSFEAIFDAFDVLPKSDQTPQKLQAMVNAHSQFSISLDQAQHILDREPNLYRVEGHKDLSGETYPRFDAYKEYYVYGDESRQNLLGQALAKDQGVVWATGTHTSTPILILVSGPAQAESQLRSVMHSSEMGRRLAALMGLGE